MKKLLTLFLLVSFSCAGVFLYHSSPAVAAFNAGNLIDDFTFNNVKTLNPAQIDSWLNSSFPASCISTNSGFSAADPTGYSPNPSQFSYSSTAVSAGQIIYDTSQAYGINPQVLIVTLQKEEGLVDGSGPYGCGATAMASALGYGCTDSGTNTHDYNYPANLPTPLYYRNGIAFNSITGSCVNSAAKAGFSEQLIHAAWLLAFGMHKSEGDTGWAEIKGNWNNCDDNNTCPSAWNISPSIACYGGPMTQGYLKRCPTDSSTTYYDGYTTIDGTSVHMDNGATAALYWYTPHFHGNQSFDSIFNQYFGSLYANCVYPTGPDGTIYRLLNPNTNGSLLSGDPSEVCAATGKMGYVMDSALLFTSGAGATPVYRLDKNGSYLFTISTTERDTAVNNYGYTLEGVAFSASPTLDATNAPKAVYRLSYPPTGQYFYTVSTAESDNLVKTMGFKLDGVAFYSQNTTGNVYPNNVYRLAGPSGGYLYTASLDESNVATTNYGYRYEGIALQTRVGFTVNDLPIYRLAGNKGYFYTSSLGERKAAIQLGYRPEGVAFFGYQSDDLSASTPTYRLVGRDGTYFYTASISEMNSAVQNFGYKVEGVAFRVP